MRRMDMHSRNQYLKALLGRYLKADKKGKGLLLDEYCRNTGQNRKYVIRKIRWMAFKGPLPRKKERGAFYGSDVKDILEKLWQLFDCPCGQRLKPLLEVEVDRLRDMGEIKISDRLADKLKSISSATIDRLLKDKKEVWRYKRRHKHSGGSLLYKKIPLRLTDWDTNKVGYVEIDLVSHCGASTAGEYINTLSTIEISSGWWEAEAVMGRGQHRTYEALNAIRKRTPFEWKGIDSDNDSAFINHQLLKYCHSERLEFTRSRPGRKNDNAHIEQKNYTHIRRPLGYLRYDTEEELEVINGLYRNELRLYKNFFQPVMKLIKKERVDGRLKRVYDVAKTPYQRLIDSYTQADSPGTKKQLSTEKEQALRMLYQSLNPVKLKRTIDEKLDKLYNLYQRKKKTGVTVNPYKKLVPSTVTFFMIQPNKSRLPG